MGSPQHDVTGDSAKYFGCKLDNRGSEEFDPIPLTSSQFTTLNTLWSVSLCSVVRVMHTLGVLRMFTSS